MPMQTKHLNFNLTELPHPGTLSAPENVDYLKGIVEDELVDAQNQKESRKRKRNDEGDEENAEAQSDEEYNPPPKKRHTKKTKSKASSKSKASTTETLSELFDVSLPGDADSSVPVYESCDEVRRKVKSHLRVTKSTKTAFLRDIIRAAYPDDSSTKIQTKQLNDFLSYKGPATGQSSKVFYASYVYFEKMRIAKDEPKSEHRLAMEKRWPGEGLPRKNQVYCWCRDDEVVYTNELGGMQIVKNGRVIRDH